MYPSTILYSQWINKIGLMKFVAARVDLSFKFKFGKFKFSKLLRRVLSLLEKFEQRLNNYKLDCKDIPVATEILALMKLEDLAIQKKCMS